MKVVGVNDQEQLEVLRIVSAVLHIGNIAFTEENNFAAVSGKDCTIPELLKTTF